MIKISDKTLNDLEFSTVREQLSTHCITALGKDKALHIKPFKTGNETVFALQQTEEYRSSAFENDPIPGHGFSPVKDAIHLFQIENSVLDTGHFQDIAALSETAHLQLAFFKKHAALYPNLYRTTREVEQTTVFKTSIRKIIDRFGQVKNNASALLQGIRQQLNSLQGKIDSSFRADLTRYQSAGYLDEIKESVVENKRVLAVSAMHRRKVKGAVLGRSKTGSIVFIQPENTLRFTREYDNLKYDEKEEVKRILSTLTETLRPHWPLLVDYQELLSEIDLIAAKVAYAQSMNAVLPKLTKKRELDLKQAFHPLLYLTNKNSGKKTYPQDILLDKNNRIIVISGPNAGGKSITLKTIGLLQLMLQSGLLVPVHQYSRMCLFKNILSDIGDHQSIENHLSTYSYRLKNMRHFLKKCDEFTLFLIDEFGTGSDPELGGALAETFLEVFFERGSYGVITTHYANLKKMANETDGISNANMRFDNRSLKPEFKLQLGEAGSSFTFEVARKNGIPYRLINRSKKKVERGKIRFDKSIAKLQQERAKLAKTNQKLRNEQFKTTEHKTQLDEKKERVQEKLEDFQELYDHNQRLIYLGQKIDKISQAYAKNTNKKQLIGEVMKLVAIENSKRKQQTKKQRQKEQQHREKIKREAQKKIKPIRKKKKAGQKKEAQKAKAAEKEKIKSLSLNDRVRIEGSRAVGTIDRIEKGKAVVNFGMFTTETGLEKLEPVK